MFSSFEKNITRLLELVTAQEKSVEKNFQYRVIFIGGI